MDHPPNHSQPRLRPDCVKFCSDIGATFAQFRRRTSIPPMAEPEKETVRIVLPTRTPAISIRRVPPKITPGDSTPSQPLPKPSGMENPAPPGQPAVADGPSANRGPKKETARITVLPRPGPTAAPAINMTKTQPLVVHPTAGVPSAPVIITSKPLAALDVIPRPLCWALLAISAVIFLIQIWNYVVS